MTINEERVDRRLGYLRSFVGSAWEADPEEVEALTERLRVEQMIGHCDEATKGLCATLRLLEDVAERRREMESRARPGARHAVADYFRLLIEGLRQ